MTSQVSMHVVQAVTHLSGTHMQLRPSTAGRLPMILQHQLQVVPKAPVVAAAGQ